jgi:hypothetical protein
VLDPDHGDLLRSRLLYKAGDVRDDGVALGSTRDDTGLHVDDEKCGVRTILERGHDLFPL